MLINRIPLFVRNPEPGSGGDPTPPAPTTPPAGGGDGKVTFTPEQQAHLDKLLGERGKRGGETAVAELLKSLGLEKTDDLKTRLEDLKKLQAAQLSDQEKAKQFADEQAKKIGDLEKEAGKVKPLSDDVERYKGALSKQLEALRKGLPEHITKLLDKLDPADQLAYIAENAATLAKKPDGIPATPPPADSKNLTDAEKEKARREHEREVRSW